MLINTCILIFSRKPEEEAIHKHFSSTIANSSALHKYLYTKTLKAAAGTGLPVLTTSCIPPQGITFAQKLTHAISHTFSLGYSNVIVLGSDVPHISTHIINQSVAQLHNGSSMVLGRNQRGGVYLLAIAKEAFCASTFVTLGWQTNQLYNHLKAYAQQHKPTTLAVQLQDVNNQHDLKYLYNSYSTALRLQHILTQFFKPQNIYFTICNYSKVANTYWLTYVLRGPPQVAILA